MKALFDSLVRTFVPIAVGGVLGWLTAAGIDPDPEFKGLLATALTAGFSAVYYLAVRLLEIYVWPKFGWLIGLAKAPEYDGTTPNT